MFALVSRGESAGTGVLRRGDPVVLLLGLKGGRSRGDRGGGDMGGEEARDDRGTGEMEAEVEQEMTSSLNKEQLLEVLPKTVVVLPVVGGRVSCGAGGGRGVLFLETYSHCKKDPPQSVEGCYDRSGY